MERHQARPLPKAINKGEERLQRSSPGDQAQPMSEAGERRGVWIRAVILIIPHLTGFDYP
jgi:hypothetical protein